MWRTFSGWRSWGILLAVLISVVAVSAQPRIAIIPLDPSMAGAADVLTAQFSKQNLVVLLEREQIQKVYREQALTAGNTDYLKLGHVLGADGLLLLTPLHEDTNDFLRIRLIAVRPGLILTAEKYSWPITNLMDWSVPFAEHLYRFLPKLAVLEKDAIPISVINLRSAVASAPGVEIERQLKLLAIDRLSREKQLFVLERQKMQLMAEENQLKGLDDSAFWSGSYLLEGLIDRDGYITDKITIDATLTPPRGGTPIQIEVRGNREDLGGVTDELARKVVMALNLKTTTPAWNKIDEAAEYFGEAKWALHWGLLAEAEAASESAWALGNRSRELAALRIWSYANAVDTIDDSSGNLFVPSYPDPVKLPGAIRAAQLFCEDASLMLTNSSGVDEGVFYQGVHVFRIAVSLLDGFYLAAELRDGNEEQLAELRQLVREMRPILDAQAKWIPRDSVPFGKPGYGNIGSPLKERYNLATWEEGGVIFEKPEDAVPMFQHMLGDGYPPTELPRIIGWSWADRKRVPEVFRRFIAETSASTNPAVSLGGLCLSLVQTPFYPQATFQSRQQALLDTIWNDRDWVFGGAEPAAILGQTEEILREKYGEEDVNIKFTEEPFVQFRQKMRKAYLTAQTNFDPQVVNALFDSGFSSPTTTAEQAADLLPLMQKLPKTNLICRTAYENVRRLAGLPPLDSKPAPPKPVMPAGDPITLSFISWAGTAFNATPYSTPQVQRIIVRDGQLWAEIKPMRQNDPFARAPTYYAAINPATGASDVISYPDNLGSPDRGFDVTAESLYVSVQDHVERYRRPEKRWESIRVPINGGADITEFRGRIYLSTPDSLLEVEPNSGSAQVIASARRNPALNEMDSLLVENAHEFVRAGENLFVGIGKSVFFFVPTNQVWRRLPEIPFKANTRMNKYYSSAGALIFIPDYPGPECLVGSWFDTASARLLLEKHFAFESTNANQATEKLLGQPCWDWPQPFKLDFPCLIAEGKSLWMLHPRQVPSRFFRESEEPVIFQDDRQATLLHFEPGTREAMTVPIRFEKDGQRIDPFDRKYLAVNPLETPAPAWISCPDGFVLSCRNLMGHWLVPKGELRKHLAKLPPFSKSGDPQQ